MVNEKIEMGKDTIFIRKSKALPILLLKYSLIWDWYMIIQVSPLWMYFNKYVYISDKGNHTAHRFISSFKKIHHEHLSISASSF